MRSANLAQVEGDYNLAIFPFLLMLINTTLICCSIKQYTYKTQGEAGVHINGHINWTFFY